MAWSNRRSVEEWRELARHSGYRANALAQAIGKCPRQLRRDIMGIFECSLQKWLNVQRLANAPELLRKYQSVKRVGLELGFKRLSHFSREFKAYYGVSPSEFLH